MSFGFSFGRPANSLADVVFNARSIPNPGTAEQRRRLTGQSKDLSREVLQHAAAQTMIDEALSAVVAKVVGLGLESKSKQKSKPSPKDSNPSPKVREFQGGLMSKTAESVSDKADVTDFVVAVGCHAGKHRSVAIVEAIGSSVREWLKENNLRSRVSVSVVHRDMTSSRGERTKSHRHRKKR
jgi:RNase adaptor protein for sRNA GlmZ degradation